MVRDAGELVSKPVVDMSEGRKVGKVKDAIFDPDKQALYGLLVDTDAGEMFLNRTSLRGFGSDAVTVDTHGSVRPIATEPHARALMESGIRLRGTKMITESGDSLGTLDKILLEDDGNVACYQTSSGVLGMGEKHEVLPSHVIKIGTDAIIVSDLAGDDGEKGHDGARQSSTSPSPPVDRDGATRASRAAVNDPVQTDVGVLGAKGPARAPSAEEAVDLYEELDPEGSITSGDAPDPFVADGASPAGANRRARASRVQTRQQLNENGVPAGTDPSKETLVSVPDSQPGNLIDDER